MHRTQVILLYMNGLTCCNRHQMHFSGMGVVLAMNSVSRMFVSVVRETAKLLLHLGGGGGCIPGKPTAVALPALPLV